MCFDRNIYIFAKSIYMQAVTQKRRKLIDLDPSVFEALTVQARGKGVSLKQYIEMLLKEESQKRAPAIPKSVTSPRVIGLVGIAKRVLDSIDPNDDRAMYILSK